MPGLTREGWVLIFASAQSVAYVVLAGKDNQPNCATQELIYSRKLR